MMKGFSIAKLEPLLIILIALHSIGIGIGLLWSPVWAFKMAGWENVNPLFFPHQAGAFHIVVAFAYLIEYFHYRGILVLLLGEHSWVVLLSGVADALMGIVAFIIHRYAIREKT